MLKLKKGKGFVKEPMKNVFQCKEVFLGYVLDFVHAEPINR
jgi:hypothetical protein